MTRIIATYHIRSDAESIAARAQAIAVEQSVEMPLEAITAEHVLRDIVGRVDSITDHGDGVFAVRIALAADTVGGDAGQLMNMLFGNTSLHQDVTLHDIELPGTLFGGPSHGIEGLRARVAATGRALTCSALKPQGLSPQELAHLAARFARGGIDFIKDDHGLADQSYSRFKARVPAIAEAIAKTGRRTCYIPSLSGTLEQMRRQLGIAREAGVTCAMLAPMVAGFATAHAVAREFPDIALLAHPSLGGNARIAPPLLIGKLFRLIGADAVIFPNFGGRFGYTPDTCRQLAAAAREPWHGLRGSLPVPAGGMTLARAPELLDFYGADAMLLIGGNLLMAKEQLTEETARFTRAVAQHRYR